MLLAPRPCGLKKKMGPRAENERSVSAHASPHMSQCTPRTRALLKGARSLSFR